MNPVQSIQLLNGWHVPLEGGRIANNLISVQLALLGSIIIIFYQNIHQFLCLFFFFPNYIQEKEYNFKKEKKKEGENCFFRQSISPHSQSQIKCVVQLWALCSLSKLVRFSSFLLFGKKIQMVPPCWGYLTAGSALSPAGFGSTMFSFPKTAT